MPDERKLRDVLRPLRRSDVILPIGSRVIRVDDQSVLDEELSEEVLRGHKLVFAGRLEVVLLEDNGNGQPCLKVAPKTHKTIVGSGATEGRAFDPFFVLTDPSMAETLPAWFYRTGDLSRRPGFMGSNPTPETMKVGGSFDDFTQPRPRRDLSQHEVFRRTLDTLFRDSDVSVEGYRYSTTDVIITPLRNISSLLNAVRRSISSMHGTKKTTHRGNLSFRSTDREARIFVKAMLETSINLGFKHPSIKQTIDVLDHFGHRIEVQIIIMEGPKNTAKCIRIDYDLV